MERGDVRGPVRGEVVFISVERLYRTKEEVYLPHDVNMRVLNGVWGPCGGGCI